MGEGLFVGHHDEGGLNPRNVFLFAGAQLAKLHETGADFQVFGQLAQVMQVFGVGSQLTVQSAQYPDLALAGLNLCVQAREVRTFLVADEFNGLWRVVNDFVANGLLLVDGGGLGGPQQHVLCLCPACGHGGAQGGNDQSAMLVDELHGVSPSVGNERGAKNPATKNVFGLQRY